MTYFYKIAQITVKVSAPDGIMYTDSDVLTPYLTDETDDAKRFEFSLCNEMPEPSGKETVHTGNVRVFSAPFGEQRYYGDINSSWHGADMCVTCEDGYIRVLVKKSRFCQSITPHHVLDAMMLEHFVINRGGILLHSSFIKLGERAILFTAPSGVGKSTQARLWCELEGAELVDGTGSVRAGYLEMANVQVVSEMVNLISITRAYESNQKIIQTYDGSLDIAVNQLGRIQ